MAEGLREVPGQPLGLGVVLLTQQAQFVGVADQLVHEPPGIFLPTAPGVLLHKPECADQEGVFIALEPVDTGLSPVPVQQSSVVLEVALDPRHGAKHPWVLIAKEPSVR